MLLPIHRRNEPKGRTHGCFWWFRYTSNSCPPHWQANGTLAFHLIIIKLLVFAHAAANPPPE
jgi:hypothetical protein